MTKHMANTGYNVMIFNIKNITLDFDNFLAIDLNHVNTLLNS